MFTHRGRRHHHYRRLHYLIMKPKSKTAFNSASRLTNVAWEMTIALTLADLRRYNNLLDKIIMTSRYFIE